MFEDDIEGTRCFLAESVKLGHLFDFNDISFILLLVLLVTINIHYKYDYVELSVGFLRLVFGRV